MTTRSRQGCDECRRRRRKCGEQKPCCGQCLSFNRTCKYTLRVVSVWAPQQEEHKINSSQGVLLQRHWNEDRLDTPHRLPNGIPLSSRYQSLLHHFTQDILASLSCHPLVHRDLRQGLLPATLESPQLMSACLALSAAGFLSRGVTSLDGVDIKKILSHLQSSGLGLLRAALQATRFPQAMNETLLATCLIWCLTDVFTYNRSETEGKATSSWRIHLQGIQALLDTNDQSNDSATLMTKTSRNHGSNMHMAMGHLHQLYLSLQTLPYIPQSLAPERKTRLKPLGFEHQSPVSNTSPAIDGFLGYSDELLYMLHQINQLAKAIHPPPDGHTPPCSHSEADILLGKVKAMIIRDSKATPPVTLSSSSTHTSSHTSSQHLQEYALCHRIFQQATLIQLYRQLYHRPSSSPEIQSAFAQMVLLFSQMEATSNSAAEPCHTWVAMAMPLFTLGCEAVSQDQRNFVLSKIDGLEECIRSSHVRTIRQALKDVWDLRPKMGDDEGNLCAGELLEKLDYNIILF
ncbi:fungal-specific transcription factor domain-containing protein [Apodospora peruviana]|uniref:Fungal-specific transcription factor domain-containing protein n=1 Tax=Apodospora peruviana TaxID=516989 RepID=A0AAE0IKL4_9PEZI|nr:fungal-specific transcription factor domain-containing protein [Apodospora peruviana]